MLIFQQNLTYLHKIYHIACLDNTPKWFYTEMRFFKIWPNKEAINFQ